MYKELYEITYQHSLHDMKIGDFNLGMLLQVGVFHGHQHSLLEEVFVDERAVPLWHQHSTEKQKAKTNINDTMLQQKDLAAG